jgi:FtsH-binding integral membrane protein
MKRMVGVAVVALALGVWGGVRAWQSASFAVSSQTVLAIVIGANLVLCLWLWYRARPGSGVATFMAAIALLMVAMLLDKLPKLFWPAADGIHIAGWIASLIVMTGVCVMQIRRIVMEIRHRRSLHRGARPV